MSKITILILFIFVLLNTSLFPQISQTDLPVNIIPISEGWARTSVNAEFYRLPDGNLIFLYRDGASGRGNLVMNHYRIKDKTWTRLHDNLIDGQGQRSAYWQMTIDIFGTMHLSWVWRETWDVASNHDLCYAKSTDQGKTWQKACGEKYRLPINSETAEYAAVIPEGSELINQTSMCTDTEGNPIIAGYWTTQGSTIPQYHLVYYNGKDWKTQQISERKTGFSLSGGGTKRIPISRPQVLADHKNTLYIIFRDIERNNCVSVFICDNIEKHIWTSRDLTAFSVGQWEPTYDTELWIPENKCHLLLQYVGQGDAEQAEDVPSQMVSVLEWEDI